MIIGIQQPEHLPWLGFFNKMAQVDQFVLLEHVQYKKRYFENRNRIRSAEGAQWLTVPVQTKGRYTQWINKVEIDAKQAWHHKYLASLDRAYARAPHYAERSAGLCECVAGEWTHLAALNTELIRLLARLCGVDTPLKPSSQLDTGEHRGSELILDICRQLEADAYLSGPNGRNYLDLGAFAANGIEVIFHDYHHPKYPQLYEPFVSHLSTVDALFNVADVDDLVRRCTLSA